MNEKEYYTSVLSLKVLLLNLKKKKNIANYGVSLKSREGSILHPREGRWKCSLAGMRLTRAGGEMELGPEWGVELGEEEELR